MEDLEIKISHIEDKVNELDKQVCLISQRQDNLENFLKRIEDTLNGINDKVGKLSESLIKVKTDKEKYSFTDFAMGLFKEIIK